MLVKIAGVMALWVAPSSKMLAPDGTELTEILPVIRVSVAITGVVAPAVTVAEIDQS